MEKFLKLVENLDAPIKISVIGDSMIDEYFSVKTTKISPEFPIPTITHHGEALKLPGGAGNVVRQFEHFPFNIELFSFLDKEANEIYKKHNINTNFCVEIDSKIPRKQRYYQDDFPLARIDIEQKNYGLKDINYFRTKLINRVNSKVVIYSDYNKGVLKDMWYLKDKITIVDPKKGPLEKWKGCTVIKPNSSEAQELTGEKDWKKQAKCIYEKTECEAVVITKSENGVCGFVESGGYFDIQSNNPQKAVSVVGAGDAFIAFYAMAISLGMDYIQSAQTAFEAGTIYVKNKHNKPLSIEEIWKHIDPYQAKFILPSDKRDYKLIFTNGVFDAGLTKPHVKYLQKAKKMGDKLIVALNSDASVKRLKGQNRPIMPLNERMDIVASLDCVDFVTSFEEDTPLNLIKKIMPDAVVKGSDYLPEQVAGYGIVNIIIVEKIDGLSTTDKILKNNY
jgi:D-beta-D-heptose 7-phosphate kinase/D-beta-D-heptose 1-phosphate adenosyltransferase